MGDTMPRCAGLLVIMTFTLHCLVTVSCLSDPRTHPTLRPPSRAPPQQRQNLLSYQVKKISAIPASADGEGDVGSDGTNLTVEMSGSHLPEVYLVNSNNFFEIPVSLGRPSADGVLRFHTNMRDFFLAFIHQQSLQVARVQLRRGHNRTGEVVLPDVELFNEGGRNITFERGRNASANLTVRKTDSSSGSGSNNLKMRDDFLIMMAVRDETESNAVNFHTRTHNYRSPGGSRPLLFPFANVEEREGDNEKTIHVVLETATGRVEGLLQACWVMEGRCSNRKTPCMQVSYMVVELLPVFQRGHNGPFPEHYLGHLQFEHREGQWEGPPEVQHCRVNRDTCVLPCVFVGDGPSAVEFQRVSGSVTPIGQISLSNNKYVSGGVLLFKPQVSDANQEVTYRCQSRSGPTVLGYIRTLVMVHNAMVLRELSGVTLGSDSVTVTCVADGTPAPTLSFFTDYDVPIEDSLEPSLYSFTQTQLDNTTSQATLHFFVPADFRLPSVSCRAVNTVRGKESVDYMYFQTSPHYYGSTGRP